MERPAPGRRFALVLAFLLASLVPAAVLGTAPAQAAVGSEAAGRQVGERFNVQVLKVAPGELDGRKVWMVTVMQPAGSGNSAFQVHVLAVDQQSGELVPSFRHHADGVTLPPAAPGGVLP